MVKKLIACLDNFDALSVCHKMKIRLKIAGVEGGNCANKP